MIRPALNAAAIAALMVCARSFLPDGSGTWGVALAFGFLLLFAEQVRAALEPLKVPHVTAYLAAGFAVGPETTKLVTSDMLARVGVVNGVAVGLIALLAGTELCFKRVSPRLRTIVATDAIALPTTAAVIALLVWLLAPHVDFVAALPPGERAAVAATLGVVLASLSPSVALAVVDETRARGAVTETVLGVVVLADLFVIVTFTVMHAITARVFGVSSGGMHPAAQLAIELAGSAAVGALFAAFLATYVRRVKARIPHCVLALCFVASEIGARLHLDVMIVGLTCGLLLENASRVSGERLREALQPLTMPVFALFFAMAGAQLHVRALLAVGPVALVFAAARALSLGGTAWLAAKLTGASAPIRRALPFATTSQAGVSIGLAVLLARHFPAWGEAAQALVLGVIAVNEAIGPVLLKRALVRSGEAQPAVDAAPVAAAAE